jgi:hypothetical protein
MVVLANIFLWEKAMFTPPFFDNVINYCSDFFIVFFLLPFAFCAQLPQKFQLLRERLHNFTSIREVPLTQFDFLQMTVQLILNATRFAMHLPLQEKPNLSNILKMTKEHKFSQPRELCRK